MAKELGVAPNTWTAYKRGKSSFGLHEIAKICDALQVSPRWLLLGEDAAGKPSLYDRVEKLVSEVYAKASVSLPSVSLAATAARHASTLEAAVLSATDEEEIDLRLKLLEKEIQKELREARADPGTGKRSA